MTDVKLERTEIQWRRRDETPTHYVNQAQVITGVFDLRIRFGFVGTDEEGGRQVADEIATIIMSPQHAKALVAILGQHVAEYERLIGELALAPKTAKES